MALEWRFLRAGECVYSTGHSFFTAKYEILRLYPNSHSFCFFHSEIQNFAVVPKRPFVFFFLQQNTKFKIVSDAHSFFDYEIRNF